MFALHILLYGQGSKWSYGKCLDVNQIWRKYKKSNSAYLHICHPSCVWFVWYFDSCPLLSQYTSSLTWHWGCFESSVYSKWISLTLIDVIKEHSVHESRQKTRPCIHIISTVSQACLYKGMVYLDFNRITDVNKYFWLKSWA